ncbi:unnamed protein product [Cylindrotheca closterium]|uniref:G-protein coupled receptors family 1 profile domain-containing protein n=1 Tax=Cylindrotheca closterium TaxID=2856 RepID=A0AAD2CG89_9STRA|nr:unnamed protein product [Cylindrotheca closterium]
MSEMEASQRLSEVQERLLAVLPIPACILSILGSSIIILIALDSRKRKKWSPYTRLLIGLSVSDIVSSINIALASFLRPTDSPRASAFTIGNATTCYVSGFMTTVTRSAKFYSCMLSFYFLLTARYRLKNSFIARRIEPGMHCISLGYPLVSAIVGAYYNVYADTVTYMGCFVSCPPETNEEDCIATTLGWIFYGWPFLFVLASLIVNNVLIWLLVHGQSVALQENDASGKVEAAQDESKDFRCVDDDDGSFHEQTKRSVDETFISDTTPSSDNLNKVQQKKASKAPTASHMRRLQLVKSQAFLFVGAYAFVNIWSGIMAIAEQNSHAEDDVLSFLVKMYPIMILNALLAPMQGFFNMLVYVRPKYLTTRHQFQDQSRWWVMKRVMLGEKRVRALGKPRIPKPLPQQATNEVPNAESPKDGGKTDDSAEPVIDQPRSLVPLTRNAVSSMTASGGDFIDGQSYEESLNDKEQDRWGSNHNDTWTPIKQAPRYYSSLEERDSSLGMISELTEKQFEPIIDFSQESELDQRVQATHGDSIPAPPRSAPTHSPSPVNSRWNPELARKRQLLASLDLMMPRRLSSTAEMPCTENPPDGSWTDVPLQTPIRAVSLVEVHSEIEEEEADASVRDPPLPPSVRQESPGVGASSSSSYGTADRMLLPPVRRMSPTVFVRPPRGSVVNS